ncbi:hypothetical protein [Actinoplanes couchii]|uniref:Uncharacterized protein n=1 Tax=Actinoplanes couchii TaxID=403638 RepID=A0ABQ3XES2_9ACTN|nr:hypothetical protein [Actinoplanes couchii]MDR6319790.1 hypothetical protein [Actinoplanes couchii]GID56925.1 hypothetical protein Aco03nite_053290 [Actinoplanes couchii]
MTIETELRDEMNDRAAAITLPDDPWLGFHHREVRHRRHRRARIGVAAAALAGIVGVQSGLLPVPGWAPTVAVASADDALINSPVRGSLAADTAWQEGLRAVPEDKQDPTELWRVVDRDTVRVLYAGDVGDRRVALAYVSYRFGLLTDPQIVWFDGPRGATPQQMSERGNLDAARQGASLIDTSADGPGIAVVVGPQGSTATIGTGTPVTGVPGSGLAEAVLAPQAAEPTITGTLTSDGRTVTVPGTTGWTTTE